MNLWTYPMGKGQKLLLTVEKRVVWLFARKLNERSYEK